VIIALVAAQESIAPEKAATEPDTRRHYTD